MAHRPPANALDPELELIIVLVGWVPVAVAGVVASHAQPVDVIVMTVVKEDLHVVEDAGTTMTDVIVGTEGALVLLPGVPLPVTRPTTVVDGPALVLNPTWGTVAVMEDQLTVVHGGSGIEAVGATVSTGLEADGWIG